MRVPPFRSTLPFLVAALVQSIPGAAQEPARRPVLFKDSRGEIAQARVRGEKDILLVIASMPGRNAEMASAIAGMGGKVQYRDDAVDYLRARVPLDAIDKVTAIPALHSVDVSMGENRSRTLALADGAGDVPAALPGGDMRPAGTASRRFGAPAQAVRIPFLPDTVPTRPITAPTRPPAAPGHPTSQQARPDTTREPWPPPLSDYPIRNRYSPYNDVRALTFLAENPTYDGRGVTIAMIDMNADMLLPELQVAKSIDGKPIPKIAIYETALDRDEEDDGRWLFMDDMVKTEGGKFTHGDSVYTAPRDGTFRIAMFDEQRADSLSNTGLKGDLNRDGNPKGSSRLFAVLWDEAAGDVWMDTDQDRSFVGETVLGDYKARPVFGVLGKDSVNTPVRESIGFGVQIDKGRKRVALNLGVASHASLVVGAAVGSKGEKGRFDGMAPGARLANVSEGGAAYGQTEATIKAAQHDEVDVIYFEQSSYITRTYLPRDGRLVPSVIGDRLTARYGVSIVSPTHNYPVLGAIDDIVMGRGVIGIGGHEGKDNFFVNHGVRVEHDDNLLITGGYGPMGDGSLKPDILAPSNYVSTAQGFVEGRAIPGLYQLPPGYTIAGGTSTATPTAAGSVALLISAAKQAGIKHDPERIKWAVTRSGRWVPHIAAYMQGNGVFNVAGAWDILNKLNTVPTLLSITSRAPVRHLFSDLLPTPHEGVGLYERDGWEPEKRQERTITFTRANGPGGPMTFDLSWAGNDHGAFSAPLTVTLPLGRPVPVTLAVEPPGFGVFTAHLTLSHPDVPGYAYRTTATVVAPEPLNEANQYRIRKETKVPRPGMQSFFFQVPEGAAALRVDLGWTDRQVSLTVVRPDTRQTRGDAVITQGRNLTHVVWNPMPGMWEVRLTDVADTQTFDWQQAKKLEPVPPTPATLTISALAVDVERVGGAPVGASPGGSPGAPPEPAVPPSPVGDFELALTNRMAEFKGGATSTPVASARLQTLDMAEKEQKVFELEVLPGSPALLVRAFGVSDPGADVDVYVFDCTKERCAGARVDADPVGDEWVTVTNPAAGKWKVVVDVNRAPSGRTTFQYLDAVLNPSYGMLTVTDTPQERAKDARWSARAHLWIAPAAHGDGRMPMPVLAVQGAGPGESAFWLGLDALLPPPPGPGPESPPPGAAASGKGSA